MHSFLSVLPVINQKLAVFLILLKRKIYIKDNCDNPQVNINANIRALYSFNRGRRERHTFATPSSLSVGIGVVLANLKSLLSNRFDQGLLLLFIDNSDSEFLGLTFDLATQEFHFMGIWELCIVSCFKRSTLGNQEFCSGKNYFHELLTLFLRPLGRTAQAQHKTLSELF